LFFSIVGRAVKRTMIMLFTEIDYSKKAMQT
jgi:hypothetical protein